MAFQAGAVVGQVNLETGEFTANITKAIGDTDKMTSSMLGAQIQFAILEKAIQAVTGVIKDSLGSYAQSKEALAQTEARIKSTGGAAGLTAKDIQNLGSAMQEQTTYADDDVQAMDNLLLTFTNVRGDTFKQATEVILDMSTALGQDLKSSCTMVGKALQDPVLGVTALRKVGVNLTESQKDMIEQLLRAGKVEEAQAVILKELQTEFGGAAKASKDTFGGAMKSIKNDLDDVQETIGGALAPTIQEFVTGAIKPAVEWLKKIDEGTVKTVVAFGAMIATTFAVGKAIQAVSNMLKAGISPLQGVLMAMAAVGAIVTVVNEAMARARTIHGELAESYIKEYEAIDGQVSRYDELKNKTNLSRKEKTELIKIEGTLKQQLGEETAFIQDQTGKWTANANAVQKFKKERLELAIKELGAQKVVAEGEKKWALERQKVNERYQKLYSFYLSKTKDATIAQATAATQMSGELIKYQLDLTSAANANLFSLSEVGKTTDKLAETTGQLDALTQGGVVTYRAYTNELNNNTDAKLTNTIVTDQMIKAGEDLASMRRENSLEFMTEEQREVAALEDRIQIMRDVGASEEEITEYYNARMAQIAEKYAGKAEQAWRDTTDGIADQVGKVTGAVSLGWGAIEGVWSQAIANEEAALDAKYEKQKANIEATVQDETARTAALEALDADYQKKKAEMQRKAWVAEKASKIGSAIMSTAQAVTSALAVFPPPVGIALAALVGGLGAIQIGLIAAEPMPAFGGGGDVKAGTVGIVGEKGPEIVEFDRPAHVYTAEQSESMMRGGTTREVVYIPRSITFDIGPYRLGKILLEMSRDGTLQISKEAVF